MDKRVILGVATLAIVLAVLSSYINYQTEAEIKENIETGIQAVMIYEIRMKYENVDKLDPHIETITENEDGSYDITGYVLIKDDGGSIYKMTYSGTSTEDSWGNYDFRDYTFGQMVKQ